MDECSGYVQGRDFCKHSFPQTFACLGRSDVLVPVCCNETLYARFWPATGGPQHQPQPGDPK